MFTTMHARRGQQFCALVLVLGLFGSGCGNAAVLEGDIATQGELSDDGTGSPAADTPEASAVADAAADAAADGAADPESAADIETLDGTQITLSDGTEQAQETTTAIDSGVVLATGGAVDTITRVEVSVGSTVALSGDLGTLIPGANGSPTDHWLITTVGLERHAPAGSDYRDRDDFVLRDPAGNYIGVESMYDEAGVNTGDFGLVGRNFHEIRLVFPTAASITDLTGWNLVVTAADQLPLIIPLEGSAYAHAYPLALATGAQSQIEINSSPGLDCDQFLFATEVDRAEVVLEGRGRMRNPWVRVPQDERLISIDLTLTDDTQTLEPENGDCGWRLGWPDFILNVDGRPAQPLEWVSDIYNRPVRIRHRGSVTIRLLFQIPVDTADIELVGGATQTPLATWELALPAAVGEPGADLVPATATLASKLPSAVGERPATVTSVDLQGGGAVGDMFQVEFELGTSVATNVDPADFVNDVVPAEAGERTWLVTEIGLENNTPDLGWYISNDDFVLVDPQGRPHAAAEMYDRTGDGLGFLSVAGPEFLELRVAFETNGLVTDLTGWSLQVDSESSTPLVLPFDAEYDNDYAVELPIGQTATISYPDELCDDNSNVFDVEITAARLDREGPDTSFVSDFMFLRVNAPDRLVVIDLNMTSLGSGFVCGSLQRIPPEMLKIGDRFIQPLLQDRPSVEPNETSAMTLVFVIPASTEAATLIAAEGTVLADWVFPQE